eukprot:15441156-Alexandrium_andersonii.AAC.1
MRSRPRVANKQNAQATAAANPEAILIEVSPKVVVSDMLMLLAAAVDADVDGDGNDDEGRRW